MIRFSFLGLLAACATAPARPATPEPPAVVSNQAAITRFQLLPTHVPGPEGRHSASHSSANIGGSLELVGDHARLVLEIASETFYIGCPGGKPWDGSSRQACVANPPPPNGPTRSTLAMTGTARWSGDQLRVEVRREVPGVRATPPYTQRLVLACSEGVDGLACQIEERDRVFEVSHLGALQFTRAQHPSISPRMASRM